MKSIDSSLRVPFGLVALSLVLALVSVAMFVGAGWVTMGTVGAGKSLIDVPAYSSAVLGDVDAAVGAHATNTADAASVGSEGAH